MPKDSGKKKGAGGRKAVAKDAGVAGSAGDGMLAGTSGGVVGGVSPMERLVSEAAGGHEEDEDQFDVAEPEGEELEVEDGAVGIERPVVWGHVKDVEATRYHEKT